MISTILSQSEQDKLIRKLGIFKIQGRDKRGRPILRIIGKYFPARLVSVDALKKYLEAEIFPGLEGRRFSVVYVNTEVNRAENFAGISALRSIYDAVPVKVWENLDTFYFLHPGLQSRLFLATLGRVLFASGGGLYGKVKYVNRVEFLWDYVRRIGFEMPEFVSEFDEEMESRGTLDYGLESDHPGLERACSGLDSAVSTYSMRCIA
ncbi:SEC14 cytosolic factor family protein / phosphoglyceride transfer family protein [Striga hermonthica]|uniref:SEC14 cytosolic factor family protein / phosphoglyceride transfer family protein n=1 Tax=Striga hermonthica TaxID=68872 RepID=A0A9N7RHK0_STRHE|nr:SEC14 cytosolic factor family protein / phosphoglyceride transfer family protein [Striga hermonthica]